MAARPNVIDLPIVDSSNEFFSRQALLITALIVALFGTGLAMRHMSLNDPVPTYVASGVSVLALVMLSVLRIARRCSVAVHDAWLIVKTGDSTQRIPLANLQPQGLRMLDLSNYCNLGVSTKIWHSVVPYAKKGTHFLLNGERVILLITDPSKVCRLRSYEDGVILLLSLQNPDRLDSLLRGTRIEKSAAPIPIQVRQP
jgi:hypothetical protein